MKIINILAAFRKCDGGPPRSVSGISGGLAKIEGVETHLLFGEDDRTDRAEISDAVHLHPTRGVFGHGFRRFNGHGFGQALKSLQNEERFDLIHSHGLWLKSNHEVSATCRRLNLPVVISPRGMLEPWALHNRYWKKKLALLLYARKDLRSAAAFHATAQSEAESIRRLGFKQPIAVIPNGIVLPDDPVRCSSFLVPGSSLEDSSSSGDGSSFLVPRSSFKGGSESENKEQRTKHEEQCEALQERRTKNEEQRTERTALFLSRINPKKGLPMLLDAWAKLAPVDWRLVIAGNDDSKHLPVVERKIRELGLQRQVTIAGPLFGEAKEAAYRNADLFVLPSYSENFGIVVAEALGYGLPVLTTTGCPWQELKTNNCGWWVEPTASGIEQGLNEALSTKNKELSSMGRRGRRLVEEKYQWPGIAERMLEFYDWLLNGGKQPDFLV